jgi:hypothetical protein
MKKFSKQNKILTENNEKLTTIVNLLKVKIDELEQKYFDKVVEIVCIPIRPNEVCKYIVKEISQKLNINVKRKTHTEYQYIRKVI